MNTEKPLRVLVAGLGNMGRSHALAYHDNPGFEIVGAGQPLGRRRCRPSLRGYDIQPLLRGGAARR